ncbi:ABC transporter substrate-binding protein [Microbacterium sp. PMB16]|uniref:ABC transporter substrate-binding protein n=1 Tax=Microbacterium sp. PMB16 TaxID=3120157 RepID=UPI003F4C4772
MKSSNLAMLGIVAVGAVVLAGCSGEAEGPKQDADAPITVWVDDTRTAPAEEFAAAHPELKVEVESVDNTQGAISSRIALATKAGDDLPDVVFLSTPDELSTLLANPVNFPLGLNADVDGDVLDGFAEAATGACTFGGDLYCLPNDIAQTVVYYNKPLFEQFGYTVPATFDEWLALGEKLAVEHPGYSLGAVNARYGLDGYYGSSQCRLTDSDDPTSVALDPTAEECTRVNAVLGPLLANGVLSTLDPFDPAFVSQVTDGKLLATISPSWMGEYGIKPNSPTEGQWAVAPTPTWAGTDEHVSGAVGGGIWVVSAKSENREAALEFAIALSSDTAIQSAAPTYPADEASAEKWLEKLAADPWYAEDPSAVLNEAAGQLSPTQGYVRYATQLLDSFNATVIADAGGDIDAAWTTFGEQALAAAKAAGYTVDK